MPVESAASMLGVHLGDAYSRHSAAERVVVMCGVPRDDTGDEKRLRRMHDGFAEGLSANPLRAQGGLTPAARPSIAAPPRRAAPTSAARVGAPGAGRDRVGDGGRTGEDRRLADPVGSERTLRGRDLDDGRHRGSESA